MEKLEKLYEGKAKQLYATDDPEVLWVEYKNTATAGDGEKKEDFTGKGRLNNLITSKKVNKSTRRLALRRVLGDLIAASKVSTVSEFSVADGKTKSFIKAVKDLTDAKKVLIVAASFDETTYRAARNVQEVLLMTAAEVNIEQDRKSVV